MNPPTVTVYCDGKGGEPHAARTVDVYEQDHTDSPQIRAAQAAAGLNPQPYYWKPIKKARWKAEGRGRLPRTRRGVQRLLGERESADYLTAEQGRRAFVGIEPSDVLRLRWRIPCEVCGYELRRNFGAVNREFDRLAGEGHDSISLAELDKNTIDH